MQNFLSLLPWSALLAGGVALTEAMLLVATQHHHGHLSMDSTPGVQKFHIHPTTSVGGVAIVLGVLAGYALPAGSPAFVFCLP